MLTDSRVFLFVIRTNLPKEVMAFPDFAFEKKLPSFVGHEDVRKYLEDYSTHFNLRKLIAVSCLLIIKMILFITLTFYAYRRGL